MANSNPPNKATLKLVLRRKIHYNDFNPASLNFRRKMKK
ncbi:hypothetical protein HMPREF9176_1585 [Streptococcus downei F0415]|nr:hypothetical protein HMPREF9176_1585 [Streptococcus downei F0415]